VRGSDLLDALEDGDLMLQAYVLGEQGAGPVLVEAARLIERGEVVVDKRHQPLPLNKISKFLLACLFVHCNPSRTGRGLSFDGNGTMTPLSLYGTHAPFAGAARRFVQ